MVRRAALAASLCLAGACGPDPAAVVADAAAGGDGAAPADASPPRDTSPPAMETSVYAHSHDQLYALDPDTLEVALVAPFQWPAEPDMMTDIAIDRDGAMVGISFTKVYAVDKDTAACTYLADLDRDVNGLSFLPAPDVDPTQAEILVAAGLDGSFYQLDPATGVSTLIGNYGYGSSGDIVSVYGFGTVATVLAGGSGDHLARIDVATGAATLIGDTDFPDIWGLGFWAGQVYGFTADNKVIQIDPATGAATLLETGPSNWWGAGVTTRAPIIP